ncbi:MAG: class I SAM-dependent methyltransferase [Planctomycetes bacterium]|nr:class I SAM-dependent methyltransferase [Planctomycetota bacterium]
MAPTSEFTEVTLALPATAADSELAARFGLAAAARDPDRWQLARSAGRLELVSPRAEGPLRWAVHGGDGDLARRLRSVRRQDPLARAVGCDRGGPAPNVVDATGGLCRDAMTLAVLDCRVTAIERVPALALLASTAIEGAGLADSVRVVVADAVSWLAARPADERPDVVCVDPMFATRGKAQVKKDMQICRLLAGQPTDVDRLLAAARGVARQRVVVKRHPDMPPLADGAAFEVEGERVRFDVYLTPA